MALQISTLFSYVRALPGTAAPLLRVRANYHGASVKFSHSVGPQSPQQAVNPATGPVLGIIKKFTTTAALGSSSQGNRFSSPQQRGGWFWLGKITQAAVLGVSSVALIVSFHTGSLAAMARKVNLNSAEGDWKETKDGLMSMTVKERRQYYRTSGFVPLEDVPVWTPSTGGSEVSHYPRNEKLTQKISVYSGDITKLEIDAIVNAANNTLLGGGGVDGAIHRAAGPVLKKECASLHGCETGEAKITCGYGLPAKYVIHTVGPIAHGGVGEKESKALRACYYNSLRIAADNAARSVAFPCISTGVYGYPPEKAVHEALATVREFLDEHHDKMDRVIFCVFLPTDKELYLQNLPLYFPADDGSVRSKL
ncbi:ADP-ribose glycohydrolase MACROD1 isoform X1 [Cynoglossus semilaevis]|uniref:ADP-ribose glycohydrolase MACROD1 isoform X1 n=1 Tax=Cynoglossus semilaevis TaxID=244447 RepID=UPI000494EE58|nr:O-acetyl-ADP-ribose deacetylase MACROD1 isoform X1 [Cynoglossus semilaevis]